MKLYTEEQLKQIFVTHYFITDKELEDLTPIELPSDEEIYEASRDWAFRKNSTKWSVNDDTAGDNMGSFLNGAKWMRNKIERGGNNEQ